MRPDPDHAAIQAIARTITDNAGIAPEITAQQIWAKIRGRYHLQPKEPVEDWRHHGPGLPTEGSEAARRLAAYRAQAGTGRPS